MTKFQPSELWIVESPEPSDAFFKVLGYLINAGVDFAFGPGDSLPNQPPESLDGIKAILVTEDDIPRIRHHLQGFRRFYCDSDQLLEQTVNGPSPGYKRQGLDPVTKRQGGP